MTYIFLTKFTTKCYLINWDNKVLGIKRWVTSEKWWLWDIPWGWVDNKDIKDNDMFQNAILREIKEECWCLIKNPYIHTLKQYSKYKWNTLKIKQFYIIKVDYKPEIVLSEDHSEYQRFAFKDFENLDFWWVKEQHIECCRDIKDHFLSRDITIL